MDSIDFLEVVFVCIIAAIILTVIAVVATAIIYIAYFITASLVRYRRFLLQQLKYFAQRQNKVLSSRVIKKNKRTPYTNKKKSISKE